MTQRPHRARRTAVGALISEAVRAHREHFGLLTAVALAGAVPLALVDAVVALEVGADPLSAPSAGRAPELDARSLLPALLSLAFYAIVTAACVRVLSDARAGRPVGWRGAMSFGLARFAVVFATSLLVLAGVLAGLMAFFVPGLWLAVAWSVATPALLLEDLTPVRAIRRSFGLVRDNWWRSFAVLTVGALLAAAALIALLIPVTVAAVGVDTLGGRVALSALAEMAVSAILLPFGIAVVTMLYFDLRAPAEAGGELDGPPGPADGERFRGFEPPAAPR